MHLTLKLETTKPAGNNFLQQQAGFDGFINCRNNERPHQALNMQCPAERYALNPSLPRLAGDQLSVPRPNRHCDHLRSRCFNGQKINLRVVFAGQSVGTKQVRNQIWLVSFMDHDLGYFDREICRLEPIANAFGPKVLPVSPE
jgi:putative transposase